MAVEFNIIDKIPDTIVTKLKAMANASSRLNKTYAELVVQLSEQVTMKVNGLDDLEKKTSAFAESVKSIREVQKEMVSLHKQQLALYGEVSKGMETLAKAVDGLAKSNGDYAKAVKRDTEEIKRQAQEEARLNQEQKKRRVTEEQISAALNTTAKSLAEAAAQNRILRKAVREVDLTQEGAARSIEEYNKKIEENERLIDGTVDSMTARKRNIGNYESALNGIGEKLKSVLGLNNEFGESIIALARENNGNVFQNLKDSTSSFGNTLLGLLKNRSFLALGGIAGAGMAFKWWYDYNKGIKEATRLTKQFTGLSGEALKSFRSDVQTLADTYNKEFVDVLRSINALTKQFGIDQQQSLKLVRDGFISGADASGEYLDILKEYPAYFKEAGISAEGFIAIVTQTSKEGIFSDKGVDTIKEANIRLREMTDATAQALEGIGISSKEVQESLQNGSATTFEIMQRISRRLSELPDSASAVGTAIADIFGGPGEDAGLQYIRTLKDIELNMENVKKAAGELGKAEEELLASQGELNREIAYLFDMTGGSFEALEAKMKSFTNGVLAGFIRGVREGIEGIGDIFRSQESIDRRTKERSEASGRGLFDTDEMEKEKTAIEKLAQTYVKSGLTSEEAYRKAGEERVSQAQKTYDYLLELEEKYKRDRDAANKELMASGTAFFPWDRDSQMKEASQKLNDAQGMLEATFQQQGKVLERIDYINRYSSKTTSSNAKIVKTLTEEEKKYYAQINEQLQQLTMDGIKNRYERERVEMRAEHDKKMSEITGNTEAEIALRRELAAKLERDLAASEANESMEVERADLENRLAAVREGSQEELDLRLALLENQKRAEMAAAEETGADVLAIEKKYQAERERLLEEDAARKAEDIAGKNANQGLGLQLNASEEIKKLTEAYTQGKMKREEYEAAVLDIQQKYARQSAELAIQSLEAQMKVANLSPEDRARLEEELTRKKIELSDEETRVMLENDAKQKQSIEQKRQAVMGYLQQASEVLNAVSGLANAIFEGRISQIEEEQEANEEAGQKELERIEELEESGVLTKEQAEARKRASEAKTEAKSEELEKKKAALQRKQAIWDKANQLAQTSIATARAIMEAWATLNPALVALISAMGAVQVATIAATPIPKYAKGTDYHPGGLAVVGDAGRSELVDTGRGLWVTPDVPTLVDLPKGASVVPEFDPMELLGDRLYMDTDKLRREAAESGIVVLERGEGYDYGRLETRLDKLARAVERGFRGNERQLRDAAYREYIRSKM